MARNGNRILALALANLRVSPLKSTILAVLAGVLIFFVARMYSRGAKSVEAAQVTADVAVPLVPDETAQVALPAPRPRHPMPHLARTLLRDPFGREWIAPTDASGGQDPTTEEGTDLLALQFTMTGDGDQATAVISGFVVHPGSAVAGYEVISIEKRQVLLRNAAGDRILRMP